MTKSRAQQDNLPGLELMLQMLSSPAGLVLLAYPWMIRMSPGPLNGQSRSSYSHRAHKEAN